MTKQTNNLFTTDSNPLSNHVNNTGHLNEEHPFMFRAMELIEDYPTSLVEHYNPWDDRTNDVWTHDHTLQVWLPESNRAIEHDITGYSMDQFNNFMHRLTHEHKGQILQARFKLDGEDFSPIYSFYCDPDRFEV